MSHTISRCGQGILFLLVLTLRSDVHAVTVFSENTTCPLCGNTFVTQTFASYGSYVYQRESKYDLIFFPASEHFWFWLCPKCGYAQTGDRFASISGQDAQRLRAIDEKEWEPRPDGKIPFAVKLERTIRTNELLGRDKAFWRVFNRVLIHHYRSVSPEKALQYAQKEIALLEQDPATDRESRKRTLYLLGEYHRMVGSNEKALHYLAQSLDLRLQSQVTMVWIGVIMIAVLLGLAMWMLIRRRLWIKVPIALCLAGFVVWTWYPYKQCHSDRATVNDYYDTIVRARMDLLTGRDKPSNGKGGTSMPSSAGASANRWQDRP